MFSLQLLRPPLADHMESRIQVPAISTPAVGIKTTNTKGLEQRLELVKSTNPCKPAQAADGGTPWSAHAADLIQWFQLQRGTLRDTPFPLNAWTAVSTPAQFYAALERDIAQGPTGVRAAALVEDLEDLLAWWARQP